MKPASWFARVNTATSLSFAARQLLSWFGSQRRGWKYSVDEARGAMGVGRQKYQATLRELKHAGFVSTAHEHDPQTGQIIHTQLTLHDAPPAEGSDQRHGHASPKGGFQGRRPEGGESGQTSSSDTTLKKAPAKELNQAQVSDA